MEDEFGVFKWMKEYEVAHGKADGQKNEFDKQLIKLGERYRLLKEIFQFQHLRIIPIPGDRKSTRLNSSHVRISYAVFCLKKKKKKKKYKIKNNKIKVQMNT